MIKRIVLNFILAQQFLVLFAHPDLQDCKNLDNGQSSNNPIFKEPSCTSECFVCKGQLISELFFYVFKSSKKVNLDRFLP